MSGSQHPFPSGEFHIPPPPPMLLEMYKPDDRSALLLSIQRKKLKKTITNDKSAPVIVGRVCNVRTDNSTMMSELRSWNIPTSSSSNRNLERSRFKPIGKLGVISQYSDNCQTGSSTGQKMTNDTKYPALPPSTSIRNLSFDHSNFPIDDKFSQTRKPVINHGKLNLAPKPPIVNVKPTVPPKIFLNNGQPVSSTHSMGNPWSPPVPPRSAGSNMRTSSSFVDHSLDNSMANLGLKPRPRSMFNRRPNAPPPPIPTQLSLAPSQSSPAPIPPPRKIRSHHHVPPTSPSPVCTQNPHRPQMFKMLPSRPPPPVPHKKLPPPPPPPRHSSVRARHNAVLDFSERFGPMFQDPNTFPRPPQFQNLSKEYKRKLIRCKQQAPQPPNFPSTSRR